MEFSMRSICLSLRPVLLAIGLMTVALPNVASAAPTGEPFVSSYAGTPAFTSASTVQFSGSGKATLLGASTNTGDIVIHGPDASCPGGLANTNVETLWAANGDTLVLTMHDVSCPVGTNVYHGTGHWEVTGGTGRFLGATGGTYARLPACPACGGWYWPDGWRLAAIARWMEVTQSDLYVLSWHD
jgi:hypothetical protein